MKKTLLVLLFLAIYSVTVGQTLTVSVPNITAAPMTYVYIPVKLSGASSTGVPISSANIHISYDMNVLEYDTLVNFYSAMPVNQWFFSGHDGIVAANWVEPSLLTLAVPNNTTLYEIKFLYKGGTSPLNFLLYEFTNAAYDLIPTTPVNGSVSPMAVNRQVTFKVDMSKQVVSPDGVHLAGSFNSWNYTQTPMTLTTNGVYTATLSLTENTAYQYRFVNGNSATGLETVPASCGVLNGTGQYDRGITVPTHDTVYSQVCFNMCGPCPANVLVTFMVDMQNETVSPNGVHVAGNFNNWNYSQTSLSWGSGTVYQNSIILEEGSVLEFRYVNGNTSQNAETVPAACSLNGNRYFTVPGHDTVMTPYCFGECIVCGGVIHYTHVTFRVNMISQDISSDGVHIAGTFQGWNPASTPMLTAGDSIYTYSDSLLTGTSVQYKFVNGNTEAGYEVVPFFCSSNGSRTLLVPQNDTILKLYCFAECDTCILDGIRKIEDDVISLSQNYPNPCSDFTRIDYSVNRPGTLRLTVYDLFGRVVTILADGPVVPGSVTIPFSTAALTPGFYTCRMEFAGGREVLVKKITMIVR